MSKTQILLFAILCHQCIAWAQETRERERGSDDSDDNEVIERKLHGYKKFTRPPGTNASEKDGGPVVIHINFFLRRLADIDGEEMNYHAELTFRQQWKDVRLAYDTQHVHAERPYLTYRHSEASEKIWTPDTFFQNAIDVRDYELMEPNEMVRVHPDGTVVFSKRVGVTVAQTLDFDDFPFDAHYLALDISSYGHDVKDIVYKWREENAVQVRSTGIQDQNFKLIRVVTRRCVSGTHFGRYSCLRAEFLVQRKAALTQLFEFFGPSFVLVIVSWIPFMISTQSILTRAIIGLSCLITIILQIALIDEELPDSHEFTWAHIWLTTCFAFIVAAQFQLVPYAWLARFRASRSAKRRNVEQQRRARLAAEGHTNEHSAPLLYGKAESTEEPLALCTVETFFDLASLLVFVVGFFIFNCYYWGSTTRIGFDEYDIDDGPENGGVGIPNPFQPVMSASQQ